MESVMRLINRTSRCFNLYRSELLECEGISGRQHQYILRVCENPGITQDQLAENLYVNKSNVTRQLAQLEQGGFITRETPESDRRHLLVYPTERAKELYPKIKEIHRRWNERLLEGFDEGEKAELYRMMERIMERALYLLEEERSPAAGGEETPCE